MFLKGNEQLIFSPPTLEEFEAEGDLVAVPGLFCGFFGYFLFFFVGISFSIRIRAALLAISAEAK